MNERERERKMVVSWLKVKLGGIKRMKWFAFIETTMDTPARYLHNFYHEIVVVKAKAVQFSGLMYER